MSITAVSNTLITSRPFPEDISLLTRELNKMYTEMSQSINFKTNGMYELTQTNTSNSWFSTGNIQSKRQSFRQVYQLAALPNNTTATIPLGFSLSSTGQFVNIYGVVESSTISVAFTAWVQGILTIDAPYLRINKSTNNIEIITISGNWTTFSGTIILEYLLS